MTAERLAAVAGLGLTALFSYVPGLDVWYERQSGKAKSLIMLGLVFVSALSIFGLSCYSPYKFVSCTEAGAWELAEIILITAVSNLVSHGFTKKLHTERFFQKVGGSA
jgi:hypothetical protein